MAFLRALQRALPPLSSPAAALLRRAPHALPPPPAPLRFLDPIGLRPFSAVATASQAPPMGASLFGGLMDTRFPKRRPGFANRRKRASLRPKGVEDFFSLSFLAIEMLRSGLFLAFALSHSLEFRNSMEIWLCPVVYLQSFVRFHGLNVGLSVHLPFLNYLTDGDAVVRP